MIYAGRIFMGESRYLFDDVNQLGYSPPSLLLLPRYYWCPVRVFFVRVTQSRVY